MPRPFRPYFLFILCTIITSLGAEPNRYISFPDVEECKSHILEGLAKIGSESTVPFLMTVLKEPHQTFRIIAACAILQCLNN